ncbi:MAG TPA: class I SAM-dependent methyltransferase [Burkholderiales bacterium]|nr:class I SAM-dependent methyltransferase [Burkholderiales bacterium]
MSTRTFTLPDKLYRYLIDHSLREPDVLRRLREETSRLPMATMQIAPEQGQFLQLLVRMLRVKRALEVGVFTGYSSLAVALAMPHDGRLVACDLSEEWTSVARRYWKEAGVERKIELRLAPALQTLDAMLTVGEAGTYDYAFIDADKVNYLNYYERVLRLLRPGGLIAVDNTLWNGAVADRRKRDEDTEAIRAFNRHLHSDSRIFLSLVPIGDGLTLALKSG